MNTKNLGYTDVFLEIFFTVIYWKATAIWIDL